MEKAIMAGAAAVDITPAESVHLFGYPHFERYSTGVHDPLIASALYLNDGRQALLFISCDIIFIPKALAQRARKRIERDTDVPMANTLIAATHTHSGPGTVCYASNEDDSTVPPPSDEYLQQLENGIVAAAQKAASTARSAEVGTACANGSCVGSNRRDPQGPSDPQVPVLIAREASTGEPIGIVLICAMHPTVLHEDSTLISGDFPGLTRRYLQREVLGSECPVVHFMGASGNQSPRHVVEANTFAEANRLGIALAKSVADAISVAAFTNRTSMSAAQTVVDFPVRSFPDAEEVARKLEVAEARYRELRARDAAGPEIRTAECDLFGAQETVTLARAAQSGRLAEFTEACLPAEIQLLTIGPWRFVGWPGEVFVEFALELRSQFPDAYVITLANGELQGYVVTEEAVNEGGYEASNALFKSPDSGQILLTATRALLEQTPL